MRRRIRRQPQVADDIIDIAVHIAHDSIPTALRFINSTEETLQQILCRPSMGRFRDFDDPRLAAVRSRAVKGFRNHLIFYEIEPSGIYILAIVHGARDLPRILNQRAE